ncbi:hypothetical protein FJT64_015127 [Amphibalanus amphitrite]|uniref:Reverse transcriptase n=1 Tax=Amphibalanus amphitrite TaxID=1232801 RepID=A0A6A4XAA1_AMPAM|nr:hypothetical protein FJT64_015127 [Amphibalanus amphitrite]
MLRDWRRIDLAGFHADLDAINWSPAVPRSDPCDLQWDKLVSSVEAALNRHAPVRAVKMRNPTPPPITDDTRELIVRRRQAIATGDETSYAALNTEVRAIRSDYRRDIQRRVDETPSSALWRELRPVIARKVSSPAQLENLTADDLNRYFTSVGEETHQTVIRTFQDEMMARRSTWEVGQDLGSDHLPMKITIRASDARPQRKRKARWAHHKADWRAFQDDCEAALTGAVPTRTAQEAATRLTETIQNAAKRHIPRGARADPRPWALHPDLQEAIRDRQAARREIRPDDPDSRARWIEAKQRAAEVEGRVSREQFREFVGTTLNRPASLGRVSKILKKWEGATDDEHRDGQAMMDDDNKLLVTDKQKANAFVKTYAQVSRHVRNKKVDLTAKRKFTTPREVAVDVHQLRAGHWSGSAQYLHRIGRNPGRDCAQCNSLTCRAAGCRCCGEEEADTPAHILLRCPALMRLRLRHLGNIHPSEEEVRGSGVVAALGAAARYLQSREAT